MVLSANILPIIAWHALFLVSFSSMGPAVAPGVSHWPPGDAAAHSFILKGPQLPLAPSKQGVKKSLKIQADEQLYVAAAAKNRRTRLLSPACLSSSSLHSGQCL